MCFGLCGKQMQSLPALIRKLRCESVLALPAGGIFFYHTLGESLDASCSACVRCVFMPSHYLPPVKHTSNALCAAHAGVLAYLTEHYDVKDFQLVGASSSALVATLSACGAMSVGSCCKRLACRSNLQVLGSLKCPEEPSLFALCRQVV